MDTSHIQTLGPGKKLIGMPAAPGRRLINLLIDLAVLTAQAAVLFIIGMLINWAVGPFYIPPPIGRIAWQSFMVFNFWLYYFIYEYYCNGSTVGKMLTGTQAVRKDGLPLTAKDAALRSLCRLIPFDALGTLIHRPLHDSFTNTEVVLKY